MHKFSLSEKVEEEESVGDRPRFLRRFESPEGKIRHAAKGTDRCKKNGKSPEGDTQEKKKTRRGKDARIFADRFLPMKFYLFTQPEVAFQRGR
jgi:hypothetical protein